MKTNKIISLEEILRKREAPLIQKYSWEEDYEKVNKIVLRRMWRENRRVATKTDLGEHISQNEKRIRSL